MSLLTSALVVASSFQFGLGVPGTDYTKLAKFYNGLDYLGAGGIDVLYIGDSRFRGQATAFPEVESIPSVVSSILQAEWNPPGVTGGPGFIPTKWTWSNGAGGTVNPLQPMVVAGSVYNDRLMSGTGHVQTRLNAGAGSITYTFDKCTDIEAVYQGGTGGFIWTITGGATLGATVATGAAEYGLRALLASGLNPALSHVLTITPPLSGHVRISGVVKYNGDFGKGIRGNSVSCSGVQLYDPASNNGWLRGDDLPGTGANTLAVFDANLDKFSSSAMGITSLGAVRAGLVIIELGVNDQGIYGGIGNTVTGRATYKAKLIQMIDKIRARPSSPAILLVMLPAPGSARESLMRDMVHSVMYELSGRDSTGTLFYPDVTCLDLDYYMLKNGLRSTLPVGYDDGSQLHDPAAAEYAYGYAIAHALMKGRTYYDQYRHG